MTEKLGGEPFVVWWHSLLAAVFVYLCVERAYQHSWGWLAFDLFFLAFSIREAWRAHLAYEEVRRLEQWRDFLKGWLS